MNRSTPLPSRELTLKAGPSAAPSGLSSRFLSRVRARLGLICLVLAGAAVFGMVAEWLLRTVMGWESPPHAGLLRGCQCLLVLTCLAVFGLTRLRAVSGEALLVIAPVFTVVGAALLSVPGFWGEILLQDNLGRLPWAGFWLALMPLIVPLPLGRAALTAVIGATTPLLIHLAWQTVHGTRLPDDQVLLYSFLPVFMAAGMGLVPSQIIYSMGKSMSAAEDRARQLGSYHLVELLGKGGMGEVWRAEHALLARPAAVKVIAPDYLGDVDDPEERATAVKRFEREARTTSSLRSPHTIALYDFGVAPDESLYYVMELLEGTDLESLVNRFGPLGPDRAIHLLRQACCSLAEAHQAGLIHRDIKPANIYTCKLGVSHDFVKVLDFGLVGMGKGNAHTSAELKLTAEGYIVGTPAFLPPEMASGKDMDGRADIYALGCVAYWLLTGQFVFDEENAVKMIIAHAQRPPERPSKRLQKPIPADLEEVIMACLAKDPADRPQDAMELAARLCACEDSGKWTDEAAHRWWEEHHPERKQPLPDEEASARTETWVMPRAT